MAFRRACTYEVGITTPEAPSSYVNAIVTFRQDNVIINKNLDSLTIDNDEFIAELSQSETNLFTAGARVWMQIRCLDANGKVTGSPEWPIDVLPVLNDSFLSAPESVGE